MTFSEETIRWILGGGASIAVLLLGMVVKELRALNSKIGELLLREAHRDAEVETVKSTIARLPCVKSGYHCETLQRVRD